MQDQETLGFAARLAPHDARCVWQMAIGERIFVAMDSFFERCFFLSLRYCVVIQVPSAISSTLPTHPAAVAAPMACGAGSTGAPLTRELVSVWVVTLLSLSLAGLGYLTRYTAKYATYTQAFFYGALVCWHSVRALVNVWRQ